MCAHLTKKKSAIYTLVNVCSIKCSLNITWVWFYIASFVQSCYPVYHYLGGKKKFIKETNVNIDLSLRHDLDWFVFWGLKYCPFKVLFPLLNFTELLFLFCFLFSVLWFDFQPLSQYSNLLPRGAVPSARAANWLLFFFN